jgi:cytochrome d ubiquinol oxidase subunit II
MLTNLVDHPWRLVFPLLAVGALIAMLVYQRAREWARAFYASCLFIVGLLTTMAAGLYPNLLPAREGNPNSLTIDNAAAGSHTLKSALIWWPLGMVLAGVYFVYAYRMFFRSGAKPQLGTE